MNRYVVTYNNKDYVVNAHNTAEAFNLWKEKISFGKEVYNEVSVLVCDRETHGNLWAIFFIRFNKGICKRVKVKMIC